MTKRTPKYRVSKNPSMSIMVKVDGGVHIHGPISMRFYGHGKCGRYDIYHGREHIFIKLNEDIGVRLCDVKATDAKTTLSGMRAVHKAGLGPKPISLCNVSILSLNLYKKPGKFPAGKYKGIITECMRYTSALEYVYAHVGIKLCTWKRYFQLVKRMGESTLTGHSPKGLALFQERVRKLVTNSRVNATYKKVGDVLYDTRTASWRLTDVR